MKQLALLIACAVLMTSCAVKQNPWLNDLDFIYKSILENHPGVYNNEDPNFCENLENAYETAKSAIKKSKVNSSSKIIIYDFAKSFNDAHLWVHWLDNTSQKHNAIISKFSISEPSNEFAWITLPTFDLNIEQKKDFRNIIKVLSQLQTKKYIVFDLRGNEGGNSDYGSQIVNALFGNEYANQKKCLHNNKVFVDWRVSHGNLSHISSLLTRYPTNQSLQGVNEGLQESLERGDSFYREYSYETCGPTKNITSTSEFGFKSIVITDSFNVSAALDFIDELKIMTKKVILIGQKTKADRVYMEVRSLPLPSGSGTFWFPIKVYRNRHRLDNEPYVPDIEFNDVGNTPDLKSFILEKIKRCEL
jgi:hypothetical protein